MCSKMIGLLLGFFCVVSFCFAGDVSFGEAKTAVSGADAQEFEMKDIDGNGKLDWAWRDSSGELKYSLQSSGIPTEGLVAYYSFNGNANDESGNERHLIKHGNIQFTMDRNGISNNAVWIDGTSRLSFNSSIGLSNQNATLSTWVLPEEYRSQDVRSYASIVIYDFTEERSIRLWVDSATLNGTPEGNKIIGQSAPLQHENIPTTYYLTNNTNEWCHALVTIRDNSLELWINGQLENSTSINNTGSFYSGGLGIGGNQNNNTQLFKGKIDDVRIYNRALSESEIQALYNESK